MQSETFPPRTTASSAIVASKPSLKVVGPKPSSKVVGSKQKKRESYSEEEGGGLSAEDDSREKEMAMSSPMKGNELRSTKVSLFCIAGHFLIPF